MGLHLGEGGGEGGQGCVCTSSEVCVYAPNGAGCRTGLCVFVGVGWSRGVWLVGGRGRLMPGCVRTGALEATVAGGDPSVGPGG